MLSHSKKKLLTELLNLPGVEVRDYRQYETIGIILVVESETQESICHRCGNKSNKLHQNHWHIIKDLPLNNQSVYLEINRRQFKCSYCLKPCLDAVAHGGNPQDRAASL